MRTHNIDRQVLKALARLQKGEAMSGAKSRRKGKVAELAVVAALRRMGVNAMTSRAAAGGMQKGPDILSDLPVVLEVKNHERDQLPAWLDQARRQADDAPGAVVHKRRGKADASEWFVTMQLDDFVQLMQMQRKTAA